MRLLYCLLFIIFIHLSYAQEVKSELLTTLSSELVESSGLIYFDNHYWSINDSGGRPWLYRINSRGEVTQRIKVVNAENRDWEALTQDKKHIYISDTGNNEGNRSEYTIYRIAKDDIPRTNKNTYVLAKIIRFEYSDQAEDLVAYSHNFDCEALFSFNGELALLTKNWETRNANLYLINQDQNKAIKQNTFESKGLVTGADYNSEKDELVWIGYQFQGTSLRPFIGRISNFSQTENRREERFELPKLLNHQTEGICMDSTGIVISCEETSEAPQALFRVYLP